MGDPRKLKKKFSKPSHPWQATRIQEEAVLVKDYALKNKKEIWKAASLVKKYKTKTKEIIASQSTQAKKEEKQILDKLIKLNLLSPNSKIGDVLDLGITTVLERRLQTLVYKKGLARTPAQARQFVVHGHITVNGMGVNLPSYLVPIEEEPFIAFFQNSSLKDEEHPERKIVEKKKATEILEKPKEEEKLIEEAKKAIEDKEVIA